jgi:hypothetical protein
MDIITWGGQNTVFSLLFPDIPNPCDRQWEGPFSPQPSASYLTPAGIKTHTAHLQLREYVVEILNTFFLRYRNLSIQKYFITKVTEFHGTTYLVQNISIYTFPPDNDTLLFVEVPLGHHNLFVLILACLHPEWLSLNYIGGVTTGLL